MNRVVPTSIDVAKAANVSQSSVSRAFNPGSSIKESKRQHILKVAREIGYRPNALARSLISGQSKIIALVVAQMDNSFFSMSIEQFSSLLQDLGYQVLLFVSEAGEQDELIQRILDYKVDGVLLLSVTLSSEVAKRCERHGIPVVLYNRNLPDTKTNSVVSDNLSGGYMLGEYLLKKGYRRIGYIRGLNDSSTSIEREIGLKKALGAHGYNLLASISGDFNFEKAQQATKEMMDNYRPDAIFASNDYMAIAAINTLRGDYGLEVGTDIGVVGFDNIPESGWEGYKLTTAEQPVKTMVELATSLLIDQINSGKLKSELIRLPVRIIERQTA